MFKVLRSLLQEKEDNVKIFELKDERGQDIPMKLIIEGTRIAISSANKVNENLILTQKLM